MRLSLRANSRGSRRSRDGRDLDRRSNGNLRDLLTSLLTHNSVGLQAGGAAEVEEGLLSNAHGAVTHALAQTVVVLGGAVEDAAVVPDD